MSAPIFVIEESIPYEGSTVERIITDEAEARRIYDANAEAGRRWKAAGGRSARGGTTATCWRWTGTEYEIDATWPVRP